MSHLFSLQHQTFAFVVGKTRLGPALLFLNLVALLWFRCLGGAANAIELVGAPSIKGAFPSAHGNKRSHTEPRLLSKLADLFRRTHNGLTDIDFRRQTFHEGGVL